MLELVAPVDHRVCAKFPAVEKIALLPVQMELGPEIATLGAGAAMIIVVAWAVQPLELVTVTVYAPACPTVIVGVFWPPDQAYRLKGPPFVLNVDTLPGQSGD